MLFAQEKELVSKDSLERLTDITSEYLGKYNYKDGVENAYILLDLAENNKENYYKFHAHNFLGIAYNELKDTLRAKRNYLQALDYAKRLKNDTLLIFIYNNLGNIYSEEKGNAEKGILYYNKVIDLADTLGVEKEKLAPTVNIAWTYMDGEEYSRAYPYLNKSIALIADEDDNNARSQLYMLLGKYHHKTNDLDSAEYYFKEGFRIAEKDSLILPASLISKDYASMLFENGDFEEAYASLKKYDDYNSQLFEKDKLAQIEAANARFDVNEYRRNLEISKKEQAYQDELIDKSTEKILIMVVATLILIVILLILNKINQDRKKLIYELKQNNNKLIDSRDNAERLSKLKTEFLSTVSHELRTPLYGVVGLTSLLLDDKSLKKHESDLKSLKFSADYLLALINDVLQMNKMESNQVKLENISFNIQELVLSIVNTFEFTRLQNKNKVHYHIDEKIPVDLIGDPVRLSQVLMNLVGNAVKFTENGNIYINVKLQARVEDRAVIYFEVKDDGIGIPKSKQKLIFEEFSQLKSSNYNYQGTGLGLPIVKRLLELFDSQIHLKSKEGEGSVFCFSLSLREDQSPAKKAGFAHEVYLDNLKEPQKILVVDDNRINQVVTRRILEKQNFECVVAANGVEAIERVIAENFDLILMDLNMPGINGMETTRRIRKLNKNVPVVALTAVEIEEVRNEIYAAGMNDIIVKPYDVERFYQTIKRNLSLNLEATEKN
ncbi:response regulator [Salegentibacter sp. LM13S]|uniref:tetratricopeptide repeat-containing hybrid sensor histidine kinase/response regulator n=1 Tax=Salegentibacter lacus TaxID=2873599 RepID=UPI001CCBD03E|nr:response regulator [Salegentibacter lacus]MBZ9631940.1 response regulator [Salegentibacter lacus]